jgi:hypothetical protein
MPLPEPMTAVLDEAVGRRHRSDPVVEGSGGPAGNARLTAWTGVTLLVLILAELITVLDVRGYLSWHIALGTLLVPVALLKTASTSWRLGRYYTGNRPYRTAGPPPMPLRMLGPLVVLSTLGLLGSGLALIALGPASGRTTIVDVLGQRIDTLTLHQGLFIVFAVVTGLHLLARIVPALTLVAGRRTGRSSGGVPGRMRRATLLAATLGVAGLTAALVLGASGAWKRDDGGPGRFRPGPGSHGAPR